MRICLRTLVIFFVAGAIGWGLVVLFGVGEDKQKRFMENMETIRLGKGTQETWSQIYQYKETVDASASLEFDRECFISLVDCPSAFCDRFLEGDDRVIELVEESCQYDYSAFGDHCERGEDEEWFIGVHKATLEKLRVQLSSQPSARGEDLLQQYTNKIIALELGRLGTTKDCDVKDVENPHQPKSLRPPPQSK